MNNMTSSHAFASASAGAVRVRTCEPSDFDALVDMMNQPGVRHGTLLSGWRTPESLRTWYESRPPGCITICAEVDGRVVGQSHLEIAKPRRSHCASLGFAVHDAYQRRGVGSALMAAMLECADHSLGLRRVELEVFADNAAAIALYRKFGFVVEGRSRGAATRDGLLADTLHMARYADAPPFAIPSTS
ncbi:GNAT family N-acetyltransferase [Paraburkholderia silviterrae]|uniref:GNAT family N-acetyltransferase n=1 Tax=Paraburkholderia silviterrae TaxID=2528715 RepID=A0A4R5M1T9_9BURK|nr:GNAT family N-acetyltransferase [Paraburkholderia silviterrae]TDG19084.1 GNAT family N-acetyltransferase [Paraburkholderia silviterrae]